MAKFSIEVSQETEDEKLGTLVNCCFVCLVSRIAARSQVNRLEIELDVNTDIYPMAQNEFYKLVLASSVNADGSDNFDIIQYENQGSASGGMGALIDQYEYVMHGKIFKYQLDDQQRNM